MNDESDHLDRTDEDILTSTVSDEDLEAATGKPGGPLITNSFIVWSDPCCR
jgi:hypothetical protein